METLGPGDRLPLLRPGKDGGADLQLAIDELARVEPPGINTLVKGSTDLMLDAAKGANVVDTRGNRYIDLVGGFGVALLGHSHPAVLDAVRAQSEQLIHGLGDVYSNPARLALAGHLSRLAPFANAQVYFAVSGADAVEIALKTAILATGRSRILAFEPGYHGLTQGALNVTSRSAFRHPFRMQGGDHVTRLPFGCEGSALRRTLEGGEFAAVIFEPVVGREGVLFPPAGWVEEVLQIAAQAGTLTIADEIFTGLRRTGPWFAHTNQPRTPTNEGSAQEENSDTPCADLICCGKALGGGLPIGAVLGRADTFAAWETGGEALHTGTFVGHPLACAAGSAVLQELEKPWVAERLAAIDRAFRRLAPGANGAGEKPVVRGRGALWAIEFADRRAARAVRKRALSHGLLALAGGPEGTVLQLVPSLVITDRQLAFVIDTLEAILHEPAT